MSHDRRQFGRRQFLREAAGSATVVGLGGFAPWVGPFANRAEAANDAIRIGHVGVANQGMNNLKAFMEQTVAVCDVDRGHLARAQAEVESKAGRKCKAFGDYRRLLDDKDVDAIVVTTPDHWHALITVDACAAGKDVYCEKPLSLTVAEGRAMADAARKHGRVVQTGSQQRSDDRFRLACELVRSGALGKVGRIEVGLPGVNFKGPAVPDESPPAELDYDFWLGPAPDRPYNPKRVHYNFRFFWDYSGGQMTNWGAHHLDIVQWALGMDDSGPEAIEGKARYHEQGWYEVPEWTDLTYTYPGGVVVRCGQSYRGGVTFFGAKGTLFVTRGKIESDPAEILATPAESLSTRLEVSKNHHRNWLECIRSRRDPICSAEVGHRSATVCHLGTIAMRAGRKIAWDASAEAIRGDDEAAAMLSKPYRAPWSLGGSA